MCEFPVCVQCVRGCGYILGTIKHICWRALCSAASVALRRGLADGFADAGGAGPAPCGLQAALLSTVILLRVAGIRNFLLPVVLFTV